MNSNGRFDPVNNTSSELSNEEFEQLGHLKEILSSSQAIKNMIEECLVEAGLSLAPRGMVRARPLAFAPAIALSFSVSLTHP